MAIRGISFDFVSHRFSGRCCNFVGLTNIQLTAAGPVRVGQEVRQGKDQRPDGHQQHAKANPSGLGGCGAPSKVREWDEDAEGGKVISTRHRCKLRRLEVESAFNRCDADVDEAIDDDSW